MIKLVSLKENHIISNEQFNITDNGTTVENTVIIESNNFIGLIV